MQHSRLDDACDRLVRFERELDLDVQRTRRRWRSRVRTGRLEFERDLRLAHERWKQSIPRYLREGSVANLLTAPVVYSMIVPIALLDLWITLYQAVCFRVYGIRRVRRSSYIVIDRHRLAYLNGIEKLNCVFCGYANGVFAYVREIAGRTEQYWCPIRHATRVRSPHRHYRYFVDYGDAEGYHRDLAALRKDLSRAVPHAPPGGDAETRAMVLPRAGFLAHLDVVAAGGSEFGPARILRMSTMNRSRWIDRFGHGDHHDSHFRHARHWRERNR